MKKKKEIIEDYEKQKRKHHGITNIVELANIRKDFEHGFDAGYKYAFKGILKALKQELKDYQNDSRSNDEICGLNDAITTIEHLRKVLKTTK